MKNIKLIEVPSELGAGTRGASLGSAAIKIAALDFMSNFFTQFSTETVKTENQLLFEPIQSPYAKRLGGILTISQRISDAVKDAIKNKFFPLVLSGDHSNAIGTIAGIRAALPKGRLGVIWIDAHADLHTPYTTPSGNVHGMPVAASIGEDNKKCKIHDLDQATADQWEQIKDLGNINPKISGRDIVFISLRDYEEEEKFLIEKYGMKVISTNEVRRKGVESVVKSTLRFLEGCTDIYVSFDVDSLDSTISMGTGTPVSNGLKEREANDLIAKLMQNRKICCFELTEVNPTLDKENLMSEIAFTILQRSVNILLLN